MCGRYAASRNPDDLAEEFEVDRVMTGAAGSLQPDWNVAPTKPVPAVLTRRRRDESGRPTDEPERRLTVLRWGLVPSWAKDPAIGSRLINARVETVADKPAFRKAFAARRCLLPADGYYEWYGERRGRKQPYWIHPVDGGLLALAGLYEIWRDPTRPDGDPEAFWWTSTVITTTAEDGLGRIHDRMPMTVERDRWARWLDPAEDDPHRLRGLLMPAMPGRLTALPVSTEVNDVRNNGPQLIEPLPPDVAPPDLTPPDETVPALFDSP